MELTYVIITHNRRDSLLRTIGQVEANTPLRRGDYEIIVVDNASTDGTAEAMANGYPHVALLKLPANIGMPARNHGIDAAAGRYVTILDDDSWPIGDGVLRSMAYMDEHADVAAVCGRVVLPSGRCEASAMPAVIIGCGTCIRRSVLRELGGFSTDFFRQAEEYDFTFRLYAAGYRTSRFEDIAYHHDKQAGGRCSAMVARLDLRHNLLLVDRFVPEPWRRTYREDWSQRYAALARRAGHANAARRGRFEAAAWGALEAARGRQTLSDDVFERLFEVDAIARRIIDWAQRTGVKRVVLADLAKNMAPVWRGCRHAGIEPIAIAEAGEAFVGIDYRGVRVISDEAALAQRPDGVIIANTNPARVTPRADAMRARFDGPVLTLWEPRTLGVIEATDAELQSAVEAPVARAGAA